MGTRRSTASAWLASSNPARPRIAAPRRAVSASSLCSTGDQLRVLGPEQRRERSLPRADLGRGVGEHRSQLGERLTGRRTSPPAPAPGSARRRPCCRGAWRTRAGQAGGIVTCRWPLRASLMPPRTVCWAAGSSVWPRWLDEQGDRLRRARRRDAADHERQQRQLRLRGEGQRPGRRPRRPAARRRTSTISGRLWSPASSPWAARPSTMVPALLSGQPLRGRGEVEPDDRRRVVHLPVRRGRSSSVRRSALPSSSSQLDRPGRGRTALVVGEALHATSPSVKPAGDVQRPQAAQPRAVSSGVAERDLWPASRNPLGAIGPLAVAALARSAGRAGRTSRSRCSCSSTSSAVGHLRQIDPCHRLRAAVAHLVDAPVRPVPDLRLLVVARLLVVPVDHVDVAVRPVLEVDEPRPGVVRQQEVRAVRRDVAGALRRQHVHVEPPAVDVAHEQLVAVLGRPGAAEVDTSARSGRGRRRPSRCGCCPGAGCRRRSAGGRRSSGCRRRCAGRRAARPAAGSGRPG